MNIRTVRELAKLMKTCDLTELELKEEAGAVHLTRTAVQGGQQVLSVAPSSSAPVAPSVLAAPPEAVQKDDDPGMDFADVTAVPAPMVGVFYSAPAENADPFVSVGDHVRCGETLCIIEAMKLMNEIPSEINGVVEQVCVKNGQAVDYGCELFRIRR